MTRRTRHAREVRDADAALASAIKVLHDRIAKLERAVKKDKPRRIGFQAPDTVQGEVVPMTEDD